MLTEAGQDFLPVLFAIGAWGRKHRGGGDVDASSMPRPERRSNRLPSTKRPALRSERVRSASPHPSETGMSEKGWCLRQAAGRHGSTRSEGAGGVVLQGVRASSRVSRVKATGESARRSQPDRRAGERDLPRSARLMRTIVALARTQGLSVRRIPGVGHLARRQSWLLRFLRQDRCCASARARSAICAIHPHCARPAADRAGVTEHRDAATAL